MAVLFPETSREMNPVGTRDNYHYEYLIECGEVGKRSGMLWHPNSIAIDSATNNIYVTEQYFGFTRVSIFSEMGEYLNSYSHEDMVAIWGIAVDGKNLYVTDCGAHAVFHLKIDTDFRLVARIGSLGSDLGQFRFPYQLSFSTNGDLYIADNGNDRIQILDSSLHPIREVTHPTMHNPRDVKLVTGEIYVLCFPNSTCVHIFSLTGHKLRAVITCGEEMELIKPYCFCLDAKKSLVISNYYGNQIKIFSNEGDLLHVLRGENVRMFNCPSGLALTSNQKLVAISNLRSPALQIFS